jgi:hypothetical protein
MYGAETLIDSNVCRCGVSNKYRIASNHWRLLGETE